jgi:hypothetical protein
MADTTETFRRIMDCKRYPLAELGFRARCKSELDRNGVLTLEHFLIGSCN